MTDREKIERLKNALKIIADRGSLPSVKWLRLVAESALADVDLADFRETLQVQEAVKK